MFRPVYQTDDSLRPAERYSFFDAQGRGIHASQVSIERCIKAEPGEPRQSYFVRVQGRAALLKIRQIPGFRRRFRATVRHEYLRREQQFLAAASRSRLPVTRCLGFGFRREWGLIAEQALLIEWLEGHSVLRDAIRESIRSGDLRAVRETQLRVLIELFASIRGAGLADKDFGAHNILVRDHYPTGNSHRWIDLERVVRVPRDDPKATAFMAGSALASWWIATSGSVEELQHAWHALRSIAALNSLGDPPIGLVEHTMRSKIKQLVAREWIHCAPPTGVLAPGGDESRLALPAMPPTLISPESAPIC